MLPAELFPITLRYRRLEADATGEAFRCKSLSPTGVEHIAKNLGNQGTAAQGGTESGTVPTGNLEALAAALLNLSAADRAKLAAMLIGQQAKGRTELDAR